MFRRKLCPYFKKRFMKYFSNVSLAKNEENAREEINLEISPNPEILNHPDYFKVHNLFTVKDLFDARVHFGHKISSLTPLMKPFVFGSRLGHVIFDLDKTTNHLREALNVAAHIAYRGGIILFVSRNPRITMLVEQTALDCKEYAVTRNWILGTFTDSTNKFKCSIRLPDLIILLNTQEENNFQHQVIGEAAKMCIPTIAIVDSNCVPNLITYPVPGNDDSFSSVQLYCNLFKEAILRGKNIRNLHLKSITQPESENEQTVESSKENVSVNVCNEAESDSLINLIK